MNGTDQAPPPIRRMGARERATQWWDRASIYLPVLLMGTMALGSYWVLRSAPSPQADRPARALAHEPDYFMRGFSVRTYNANGSLKSEVFGQEARHFPDTNTLDVDRARIRSLGDSGRLTLADAQRLSTNAGHTDYWLQGGVRVVREALTSTTGQPQAPRLEFRGEQLHISTAERFIRSDQPVTMTRGQDRISANTLRYDDTQRVADLQGRVQAQLAPRH